MSRTYVEILDFLKEKYASSIGPLSIEKDTIADNIETLKNQKLDDWDYEKDNPPTGMYFVRTEELICSLMTYREQWCVRVCQTVVISIDDQDLWDKGIEETSRDFLIASIAFDSLKDASTACSDIYFWFYSPETLTGGNKK